MLKKTKKNRFLAISLMIGIFMMFNGLAFGYMNGDHENGNNNGGQNQNHDGEMNGNNFNHGDGNGQSGNNHGQNGNGGSNHCGFLDFETCEAAQFCQWDEVEEICSSINGGGNDDGGNCGEGNCDCTELDMDACADAQNCVWDDVEEVCGPVGGSGGGNDDGGNGGDGNCDCTELDLDACAEAQNCVWDDVEEVCGPVGGSGGGNDDGGNGGDGNCDCTELDLDACAEVQNCVWDDVEEVCGPAGGGGGNGDGGNGDGGNGNHGEGCELAELEVITVSGFAIVGTYYYLDEDGDGNSDYFLKFGPDWYSPENGAERPLDGDEITVTGGYQPYTSHGEAIIVFELNGEFWRDPCEQLSENGPNSAPQREQAVSSVRNFPNPFNPVTTIHVELTQDSQLEVGVYNINGQLVEQLQSSFLSKGTYAFNWNGQNHPSGVYLIQAVTPANSTVTRMMLIK